MTISARTRFEVLKRDGFSCRYCGRCPPEVTLDVDHVTPRALGGLDEADNLVTSCRDCNAGKAAIPLNEPALVRVASPRYLEPIPLPEGPEDTVLIPLAEFLSYRQRTPVSACIAFLDVIALAVEQGNAETGDVVLRPHELTARWVRKRGGWVHRFIRDLIARQFFESVQSTPRGTVARIAHWDQRYIAPSQEH